MVGLAMMEKFAALIASQTNFTSPVITLSAFTSPAKPASAGKPAQPERKFDRMAIRTPKPQPASAD